VAFVLVPLLVLVGVAIITVFVSERIARANALRQAQETATRFTQLLLAPILGDALSEVPGRWDELDRLVANRLSDGSMTFLVVWAPDGEVLFSSQEESIGKKYEPTADLRAAAGGRTVARISDVDDQPEASFAGDATEPMVEVYVPLDVDTERVVVEAYFSYDGIDEHAALLRGQMIPLAVGALVVLQLIQLPIATSLARRVRRQETERAELMARSLTASERDRRAIAADVHDGPVQDLAGVSYGLSALRASVPDDRQATVDRLVDAVRNAVHSLRGLIVDLYPPDLRGPGLEPALEDLAEPLRSEGLTVSVHTDPVPDLSPDSAAVIYRTAKELLANVSRHATATNVWLDVESVEHAAAPAIRLTVSDDGAGFPSTGTDRRSEGHLGLQLVAARVRDAGGLLELGERPGGGASVTAVIPTGYVR
jgi:two-component system NarL family sensor kinase